MTTKIYKKRGVAISKEKDEMPPGIFWKYIVIELKTKKVLEEYYLNH